ncbi:MAG: MBL fold metallo-hydrolase [Alphaproteobacteria bacterium]|nr:MBL fold metallo-hydrolase [Alphaproteobacteria bacterium]
MTRREFLLGSSALLAIGVTGYVNLAKFGHLPDEISLKKIKLSPHYKNGKFQNLHHTEKMTGKGGFIGTMYDFWFRNHPDTKPNKPVPTIKTDLKKIAKEKDILVWFGHSSAYFQLGGKSFLLDPVFSNNASPLPHNVVPFKGTNIYSVDDMPEIDYLIITHDHYDHLDYETILALKPKVKNVVTGLGVGSHLRYWGYDNNIINELDWYENIDIDNGKIHCLPARHFSGRLFECRTLWASFLVEVDGYKLYMSGDSGYDDHYKAIGEKFGAIDLVLLEAGQYDKNWRYIHEHPEEFIKSSVDLKAKRIIPVHNSKFCICNHPWYDPLDKIDELNQKNGLNIITPKIGEPIDLRNNEQQFSSWWKELK